MEGAMGYYLWSNTPPHVQLTWRTAAHLAHGSLWRSVGNIWGGAAEMRNLGLELETSWLWYHEAAHLTNPTKSPSSWKGRWAITYGPTITCCRNITDVSLASITSSCTSLTSLRMESCAHVSSEGLRLIRKHCCHLEELDLTDNDLDDEGLKAIARCSKLSSLKVGICLKISDEGLTHIGKACPELRDIDLYRCGGISDDGITLLAQGCPKLESINLSYCTDITDRSLMALSKCAKLNTLEIRGCPRVSSCGISEVAMGCRLLSKLDIKKCFEINDVGMLYISQFSHSLRQINLSYCSVTDIGLLSLSSICGLQNMTIIHLAGITPNGLIAALMVCGGLTKVKLNAAFKTMMPPHMLRNVEARGCVFQWINKPYKVELEPCDVWKQQSRDVLER